MKNTERTPTNGEGQPITITLPALSWLEVFGYQVYGSMRGIIEESPVWELLKAEYRAKFGRDMDEDLKKYLKGEKS